MNKHLIAIGAGAVTKTNVIGLRKALAANHRRKRGYRVGATAPRMDDAECRKAEAWLDRYKPVVTGELHESGLALLRSKRYAKRWSPGQAFIIADLKEFRLVGFQWAGLVETPTPVYEARAHCGGAFQFINVPWQNGGNGPEVLPDYD